MKNIIKNIVVVCFLIFVFVSCETDLNDITIEMGNGPENFVVNTENPLICTADNAADTVFVFTWTKADFGQNITSSYSLQFSTAEGFDNAQELFVGNGLYMAGVTSDNMNTIMHKLGMPVDEATRLFVRVKAKPMLLGSSMATLPELYSEQTQTVTVTSYALPPLHFIGSMFGAYGVDPYAWDNTNYRYILFRDDILSRDTYTGFFYGFDPVTYAGQFKLISDSDLGTWTQYTSVNGTLTTDGPNMEPAQGGYYEINTSLGDMKFSMEPYDISGAAEYSTIVLSGSGVKSDVVLQQAPQDVHIWSADDVELVDGEVAIKSDSKTWGGTTFPYGKSDGNGGVIKVDAGKYFVKFCDLTGHYVFYEKK